MRTSEAHRYARFSAAAAIAIALIAGGYFARRYLQARRAARNAPPPVPAEVQKASEGFSMSKQAGDRTIFTIRASRATQFKDDSRAMLEDVWVTIYGATGARADNIRTHSCDFNQISGDVVCAGNVQMDFQSAADAQRGQSGGTAGAPPPHIIHAETRGLSFNRDSGDAWSDQPVTLKFPGGEGSAVGVKYHSKDGLIELLRDVKFKLQPSITAKPAPGAVPQAAQANQTPILLSGSSLQYQRESGVVFLHGPVTAVETPPGLQKELHAAELSIELDTQMRARRMNAAGNAKAPAQLQSNGPKGEQILTADSFLADYAPAGWLQNFRADGHVQSSLKDSSGHTSLSAGDLDTKMAPELNAPAHAHAVGGVVIDSDQSGTQRHFESTELSVDFVNTPPKISGGHATSYVSHAETPSSALLSWQEPAATQQRASATTSAGKDSAADGPSKMALSGKRFEMEFDEQSRLRQLRIKSAAKVDRTDSSGARQTSTSDDLSASLDEAGIWSQLIQNGHVKMHDADRAGQGDHSHLDHATNTLVLTGAAHVSDADSRTSADTIVINQTSSELHADGHVVTTYVGGNSTAAPAPSTRYKPTSAATNSTSTSQQSASQTANPSHAIADHLVANSNTGKALYSGHARLWQGDATIEADTIELDRDAKQANASGNVHAVFLTQSSSSTQATGTQASSSNETATASRPPKAASADQPNSSGPTLWRVHAPRMTYSDLNLQAHLEGGFTADSQQLSIAGSTGDLFFVRSQSQPAAPAAAQSASSTTLDHATASRHVTVRQGDRHGAAELGQYSASAGTFILSGGHPTFTDASGNTTSGRELTFYLADDTILVQQEESSRPQPHHRVEK